MSELMPWQQGRAPRGFWEKPHAKLAALRWFLEKEGWTLEECYRLMQTQPTFVYGRLDTCGLSALHRPRCCILELLASADSTLLPISKTAQNRKRKRLLSSNLLKCPLCQKSFRNLIVHARRTHPDYSYDAFKALFSNGAKLQILTTKGRSFRSDTALRLRTDGIKVPIAKWTGVKWAALEMNEWSEALEIRPIPRTSLNSVVYTSVWTRNETACITLPREITESICKDTALRYVGQNTIMLRFRNDEARQVVWEWYQQRISKLWYRTPEHREKLRQAALHRNKRTGTSSRFWGVSLDQRSGTWRSAISYQGRSVSLGSYTTEEEAARAYDRKARELYGERARLNFPGEVSDATGR